MLVQLTHPFLWRCKDPVGLLDGCNKFNTFCSRLEKQCKDLFPAPDNEAPEATKAREADFNKYKGDGFELFVEAMIRLFPCDKRLGLIEDYKVNTVQDVGVDGSGVSGYNHKPITVQCKYRQHDYVLTANQDHLTNFTSASMLHFGVDQTPDPDTHKCNMVIVSSADSLNFFTDHDMFGEMVHAFCRNEIRTLVDNNNSFWKFFRLSWLESLAKLKTE
jgi:hypothetical protein